jgi:hypothetical protein
VIGIYIYTTILNCLPLGQVRHGVRQRRLLRAAAAAGDARDDAALADGLRRGVHADALPVLELAAARGEHDVVRVLPLLEGGGGGQGPCLRDRDRGRGCRGQGGGDRGCPCGEADNCFRRLLCLCLCLCLCECLCLCLCECLCLLWLCPQLGHRRPRRVLQQHATPQAEQQQHARLEALEGAGAGGALLLPPLVAGQLGVGGRVRHACACACACACQCSALLTGACETNQGEGAKSESGHKTGIKLNSKYAASCFISIYCKLRSLGGVLFQPPRGERHKKQACSSSCSIFFFDHQK